MVLDRLFLVVFRIVGFLYLASHIPAFLLVGTNVSDIVKWLILFGNAPILIIIVFVPIIVIWNIYRTVVYVGTGKWPKNDTQKESGSVNQRTTFQKRVMRVLMIVLFIYMLFYVYQIFGAYIDEVLM